MINLFSFSYRNYKNKRFISYCRPRRIITNYEMSQTCRTSAVRHPFTIVIVLLENVKSTFSGIIVNIIIVYKTK